MLTSVLWHSLTTISDKYLIKMYVFNTFKIKIYELLNDIVFIVCQRINMGALLATL